MIPGLWPPCLINNEINPPNWCNSASLWLQKTDQASSKSHSSLSFLVLKLPFLTNLYNFLLEQFLTFIVSFFLHLSYAYILFQKYHTRGKFRESSVLYVDDLDSDIFHLTITISFSRPKSLRKGKSVSDKLTIMTWLVDAILIQIDCCWVCW